MQTASKWIYTPAEIKLHNKCLFSLLFWLVLSFFLSLALCLSPTHSLNSSRSMSMLLLLLRLVKCFRLWCVCVLVWYFYCCSTSSPNAFSVFLCGLLPVVTHSRTTVVMEFHRKFHILWLKMVVFVVVALVCCCCYSTAEYLVMHKLKWA